MSTQYTAPGFELTTFQTESPLDQGSCLCIFVNLFACSLFCLSVASFVHCQLIRLFVYLLSFNFGPILLSGAELSPKCSFFCFRMLQNCNVDCSFYYTQEMLLFFAQTVASLFNYLDYDICYLLVQGLLQFFTLAHCRHNLMSS